MGYRGTYPSDLAPWRWRTVTPHPLFFAYLAAVSCGGHSEPPPPPPPPDECIEARVIPDADARVLEERIQVLVDASPDCHGRSEGNCQVCSATVERARAWCQSQGQRVLILDYFDFACAPFERILGYYRLDGEERLVEETPAVSMQAGLFTVLYDLVGRNTYFGPLLHLPELHEKFSFPECKPHGSAFPAAIADLSPLAQFVLADLSTDRKPSCDMATIERQLRNKAASVRSIVEQYQISYINYSAGNTLPELRKDYQHCGSSDEWLRQVFDIYVREWYRPLGSLPGVVFVESAPNEGDATRPLRVDDPDFLADCTVLPNRLRVACASRDDLGHGYDDVPSDGLSWAQYSDALEPTLHNLQACVEIYYNMSLGCASSFAAPRALAHLLFLQGARAAAMEPPFDSPALIAAAAHGDPPRLIDPSNHRQFEVYRMFPDLL